MRERTQRAPLAFRGMRVGLFGGSFDPAHSGHFHSAETARRRLGLDRVWWLVTPQNPLKHRARPFADRYASAQAVAKGRAHIVTDFEQRLGLRYSADTLEALRRRYPGVQFVWIMGADGLAHMHRWKHWRAFVAQVPIAVVARRTPPRTLRAPAMTLLRRPRAPESVLETNPPVLTYLMARLDPNSSTALRANGG